MIQPSTKDRILDTAERLFAEQGFAETSLRAITAEAGANLAAVNYYFQSKDALIHAVLARRLAPLNARRLAMLERAEAAGGGPPGLEAILRAFLGPVLELARSRPEFARLFGRIYSDPRGLFVKAFREHFGEAKARFFAALSRAMPGTPEEEILWRVYFMVGAMAQVMHGADHLRVISEGRCDPTDLDAVLDRLVAFLAAGFRAPVPAREGEPQCKSV